MRVMSLDCAVWPCSGETAGRKKTGYLPVQVSCSFNEGLLGGSLYQRHVGIPVHQHSPLLQRVQHMDCLVDVLRSQCSGQAVQDSCQESSAPLLG